ncbi:hypothetical protein [Nitrosomonas sp. Nm58]|uniref:hypothetical protein n=1 Tax=Nitrosomonas sp. Nm58 TaxID=200126 RepID=UPI00089A8A16|nr:hypothetical protein [Nitrosomonas sp. Nm58]SDY39224.1 hypothetical protein SAMN05421754_100874 [Nitrosomonas sp. Nm58]
MAKEKTTAETVQEKPADAVTLDEFCTRLSGTDKRVEMIGAFNHVEKKAGRVKDTEESFRSRFDAFINQPA